MKNGIASTGSSAYGVGEGIYQTGLGAKKAFGTNAGIAVALGGLGAAHLLGAGPLVNLSA